MNEFSNSVNTAARIARQQTSGSAAKSLLSPCDCDCENVGMGIGLGSNVKNHKKDNNNKRNKKNNNNNHQAKHRKRLMRMQHEKKRREHDEEARARRQTQEIIEMKERQFGNIKSRVFEPKNKPHSVTSSVSTESTSTILSSSVGSLSLSSDVGEGVGTKFNGRTGDRFHKNFGQGKFFITKIISID